MIFEIARSNMHKSFMARNSLKNMYVPNNGPSSKLPFLWGEHFGEKRKCYDR